MIYGAYYRLYKKYICSSKLHESIYILGVIVAGLLKQVIPDNFIYKHLGERGIGSIVKSTLFGAPLPLCSCSVIPMARTLHREGANSGAVTSFLISTPITGVDSIFATYSLFGLFFTIYRVVTSIIIAIVVGAIENISNRRFNPNISFHENPSCSGGCCSHHNEHSGRSKFNIKSILSTTHLILFLEICQNLYLSA